MELKYDNMESLLYSKEVITTDEKNIIFLQIGCKKMDYLLARIIIPSLKGKYSEKYKLFLEAMKESEDIDLNNTAKMLAGCLLYRTVIAYIYSYNIMYIL